MLTDGLNFIPGSINSNMVLPYVTEQQKQNLEPAIGSIVFQTDGIPGVYVHNGSQWVLGVYTSFVNDILDVKSLPQFTGDVVSKKGTSNLTLTTTGVTPGKYNEVQVDNKGRILDGAYVDYAVAIETLLLRVSALEKVIAEHIKNT
jgi:hypothetical protein